MPNATVPPYPVPKPGASELVESKRGAKKGVKRGPSRAPEIVFRGKMESTFKTATRLLEKLAALRDSRHIKNDSTSYKMYLAFLTKLDEKLSECVPRQDVTASEKLETWVS